MAECHCVRDHTPQPKVLHKHHVVPKAWGGTDHEPKFMFCNDTNIIDLCPTSHENVHRLLNNYRRLGKTPGWRLLRHFTVMERHLAKMAWDWWVTTNGSAKPPSTLAQ